MDSTPQQALRSRIAGSLISDTDLSYSSAEEAAEVVMDVLTEDYEDGKLPGFPKLFGDHGGSFGKSPFGEDPFEDEDIFDVEAPEDEVFSEEDQLDEDFFAVA